MTEVLSVTERFRRVEYVRDSRAACLTNETIEQRDIKREAKADTWTTWFHTRMAASATSDPVQLLPDAFARLEQLNEDRVVAAVRELKATLAGALK